MQPETVKRQLRVWLSEANARWISEEKERSGTRLTDLVNDLFSAAREQKGYVWTSDHQEHAG